MRPDARFRLALVSADPAEVKELKAALWGLRPEIYPKAALLLNVLAKKSPELVIIGVTPPSISARDLISVLRGCGGRRLVLVGLLAAPDARIAGETLAAGADECFAFPPDPALFRARLLNLLARARLNKEDAPEPEVIRLGQLEARPLERTVLFSGKSLKLTALEFDLLLYFLSRQGRVVSRGTLVEQVWRRDFGVNARAVDKRIEVLRFKLGSFGRAIRTVFGLGYMFKAEGL
ncbi:MAG: response regulator transcription factor [Elusimicrobia bacterium]|nr:response regulator transcription factor [Elusimicrobiota bacterium]